MQTYSLFELNNYIRQVIALNFEEAVWITCEIGQIKESRGQVYLELIQQNEDETEILARSSAAIWYKTRLFIKKKLGDLYSAILQEGTQVSIKVKVDFHERYGMKLDILDIDPAYTIGHLEMQRQKIIERLKAAGVFENNTHLKLPRVLKRIAIISSDQAAGYKDFVHQLTHNAYGYVFQTTLFQTAVQGLKVESEISAALDSIAENVDQYDCIVIIRGGGSKIDLAAFDNYNISFKIATHPLPVITGIGHEIDSSVADLVAHTSLKTPTAVADFLIEHTMYFEAQIDQLAQLVQQLTIQQTQAYHYGLKRLRDIMGGEVLYQFKSKREDLDRRLTDLEQAGLRQCQERLLKIDHLEEVIQMSSPASVLKRGYAIVRQDGIARSKKEDIIMDAGLEIEFQDDKVKVSIDPSDK
jgi:exodeoxyribonuclease VII large subunit